MVVQTLFMSTYTTTTDGLHVYVCNVCLKFYEQLEWIKYVVFQSMDYMKQILANNPLHLQLLSFIDISMKIEQWNYGFMHGQIQPSGLLDNALGAHKHTGRKKYDHVSKRKWKEKL
jgi:hypothetical protein